MRVNEGRDSGRKGLWKGWIEEGLARGRGKAGRDEEGWIEEGRDGRRGG